MLSGQLPFDAPTTAALIHKILNEPPPPLDVHGQGGLLARLLAKDATLRPSTAHETIELIEDSLLNPSSDETSVATAEATRVEPPVATPVAATTWPRWLGIGLAAAGLLALGAAAAHFTSRDADDIRTVDVSATAPEVAPTPAADEEEPAAIPEDVAPAPEAVEAAPAPVEAVEVAPPEAPGAERDRPRRRETRTVEVPPSPEVSSPPDPVEAWDGTIIESPSP